MTLDRRSLVSTLAAGGIGLAASGARAAAETKSLLTVPAQAPYHVGPLVNRDRATEVLERLGLEGLILAHPINRYYLTGFDGGTFTASIGGHNSVYAIISKNRALPVAMVMASFPYYFQMADVQDERNVAIYQYTDPPPAAEKDLSNNSAIVGTGVAPLKAGDIGVLRDRKQEPLDRLEVDRDRHTREQAKRRPVATSAMQALGKAMKDLGLDRGRVGTDVLQNAEEWAQIAALAPRAQLADANDATGLIRLVKSPAEIELMRYAARANAEAAFLACKAVRAGATHRDLRSTFYAECAQRGSKGVWMIVDRVHTDVVRGEFRNGQSFMIDAVSTFNGYHGDYGRTVFVGEPSKTMARHTKGIELAWAAVREKLRPGLKFTQLQAIGQEALTKGGFDTAVRITPHSVGILHTDAHNIANLTLEKGMIISVDFPVLEAGIGGSAHLEDLTLITADGHELLNDTSSPQILV